MSQIDLDDFLQGKKRIEFYNFMDGGDWKKLATLLNINDTRLIEKRACAHYYTSELLYEWKTKYPKTYTNLHLLKYLNHFRQDVVKFLTTPQKEENSSNKN